MSKLLVGGAEPNAQKLNEPFPSGCQTWYIFWGRRVQICTVSRAINVKNITVWHRPRERVDNAKSMPGINVSVREESVGGYNVPSTKLFLAAGSK